MQNAYLVRAKVRRFLRRPRRTFAPSPAHFCAGAGALLRRQLLRFVRGMSAVGPLRLAAAVLLILSDPALALAQSTRALRPVDAVFHVGAVRHAEAVW